MKNASELKEIADDFNMCKTLDHLNTLDTSMFMVAKKGGYSFDTINCLDEKSIEILQQNGYDVSLIKCPNGGYSYHHRISWSK